MERLLVLMVLLVPLGAGAECEVLDWANASVDGEKLQPGETIESDAVVETGDEGLVVADCGEKTRYIEQGRRTTLEESHFQVERDPNLSRVNKELEKDYPEFVDQLPFSGSVNVELGNETFGVETQGSNITELEKGGLEDPDMEIKTDAETVREIVESDEPLKKLSEAYQSGELELEAHSFRYRLIDAAMNLASKAYSFFT